MKNLLLEINSQIWEIEKKLGKRQSSDIDNDTNATNDKIMTNWLSSDTNPWSALAYKICTNNDFYDMTCNQTYLLSNLFQSGFIGSDLATTTIVRAIDKKAKLFFSKNDSCKLGAIDKNAKKVQIVQRVLGGMCEVTESMFAGGMSREQVLLRVLETIIQSAFINSLEDDMINWDNRALASDGTVDKDINGYVASNYTQFATDGISPANTGHAGFRLNALAGYNLYNPSTESFTWTPYTTGQSPVVDFNETITLQQIEQLVGTIGCCNNALLILNCTVWSKLKVLALTTGQATIDEITKAQGFIEAGNLFRFLWYTIYVSENISMSLPNGVIDPVQANNTHHSIIAVNPRALLWGFGNDLKSGTDSNLGCPTLWIKWLVGFGVCTSPDSHNVAIAVNIK